MGLKISEDNAIKVNDNSIQLVQSILGPTLEPKHNVSGQFDRSYKEYEEIKATDNAEDYKVKKYVDDERQPLKKESVFYFVKFRSYEDPSLKKNIEQFEEAIRKLNQARGETTNAFIAKKAERAVIIDQLRPLNDENIRYKHTIGEKIQEMNNLGASLEDFDTTIISDKESSCCNEELDTESLNSQFNHETVSATNHEAISAEEEKILVGEINLLEEPREEILTIDPILMAEIEASRDKAKQIKADIDKARKEHLELWDQIMVIQEGLKPLNDNLSLLEEELKIIVENSNKVEGSLWALRKLNDEVNSRYKQNILLLDEAEELAAKKDKQALEYIARTSVEAFMLEWNNNKVFREEYEKRTFSSLDSRNLTKDGRINDPDLCPLFIEETPDETLEKSVTAASVHEQRKEVEASVREWRKEVPDENAKEESTNIESAPTESSDTDTGKLNEFRREEEIAKAKMAMERKKRLAEKAAAKAALRAQKEAEKKLKEKEKKAKRKSGEESLASSEDLTEMDTAVSKKYRWGTETDNAGFMGLLWRKPPKQTAACMSTPKSSNQVLKTILNRRKSRMYWTWAVGGIILGLAVAALYYWFYLR